MQPPGRRQWRFLISDLSCICILLLCGIPGNDAEVSCPTSCLVQNQQDATASSGICKIKYFPADECSVLSSVPSSLPAMGFETPSNICSENENEVGMQLHSSVKFAEVSKTTVNLRFSLPCSERWLMLAVINQLPSYGHQCAVVFFSSQNVSDQCVYDVGCLTLTSGIYDILVLETTKSVSLISDGHQGLPDKEPSSLTDVISEGFTTRYTGQCIWGKPRHRRDGNMLFKPKKPARCSCSYCFRTRHFYDEKLVTLSLNYTIDLNKGSCCSSCYALNLVLFQYNQVNDSTSCRNLNYTANVMSSLNPITEENVTEAQIPITYTNIETGCYTFRLRPSISPRSVYHGFFWVKAEGKVYDMDKWNTSFFLQPYPDEKELEVRWKAPDYPYNFSSYKLQLWYHKTYNISCTGRGKSLHTGSIDHIPVNGITLSSTSHRFENLSFGYYCARVTPMDHRCSLDGCEPRSSLARLLTVNEVIEESEEEDGHHFLALALTGGAIGVLIAGVVVALVILKWRPAHGVLHVAYKKVSGGSDALKGVQEVLLVWTAAGLDGPHLPPVMEAFKRILTSYGRCKVYDYMDLLSLPDFQREMLLENPTTWLDWVLGQQQIKIVVVGTKGGRLRQLEWSLPHKVGGYTSQITQGLAPHDLILFPYLLRRLQDRPDLAADYSRIFHIRFSDINDDTAELEGVVSWTRYRIPQHIKALTLALHGLRCSDLECGLEEPSAEVMVELMTVLAKHPGLVNINNSSAEIWNKVVSGNHEITQPSECSTLNFEQTGNVSERLGQNCDAVDCDNFKVMEKNDKTVKELSNGTCGQPVPARKTPPIDIANNTHHYLPLEQSAFITPPNSDTSSSSNDCELETCHGPGPPPLNYIEEKT